MIAAELTQSRRIERRELISLFAGLKPGEEARFEDIKILTGLDPERTGDRKLIYDVCEHCRDVLGFVMKMIPRGGGYRRCTDEDLVGIVIESRRDRIYRQSVRGVAETAAIQNFAALDHDRQLKVLAHQSIFGAIALASHVDAVPRVEAALGKKAIASADPEEVMRAVAQIPQ